jgi:hypothetical protein
MTAVQAATNLSHRMSIQRCSYISQLNPRTGHYTFANNTLHHQLNTENNRGELTIHRDPVSFHTACLAHHPRSASQSSVACRTSEEALGDVPTRHRRGRVQGYCRCAFFSRYFTPAFWSDLGRSTHGS